MIINDAIRGYNSVNSRQSLSPGIDKFKEDNENVAKLCQIRLKREGDTQNG
ncbi:MAG: hypothetical protein HPY74_13015 [Firmicutes bacterium]|nr:hypothetical protein [Bacillota bacterium]